MRKTAVKRKKEEDDVDIRFLLGEYDRLKGLEIENINTQHRRFDFYLVAATAIVAGIIALQQTQLSSILLERLTHLFLIVWLAWGVVAFVNLTYMNVAEQHIVNALTKIQGFFFERNAGLEQYFYFRSTNIRWAGLGIKGVVLRGITGGGFKSILAMINSSILAYLSYQLWPYSSSDLVRLLVALSVLVLFGILHMLYVTILYRLKPL